MAVKPGRYDISLRRRSDYSAALQFKDSQGVGINLNGWSVAAQAWDKKRTTKYADFAITYTDRATGSISMALTDEQTVNFPDEAYYDVLLTNTEGIKEYYLEGVIYVDQGYTA